MQGHGPPVDWWAVGVLVYEMTHGHTPFSDRGAVDDVLQLYRNIGNPAFRVCYDASLPPPRVSPATTPLATPIRLRRRAIRAPRRATTPSPR